MKNKLPNPNHLRAKYQTVKSEVQNKLDNLNNELIKDELSHHILEKKDELVELMLKKYSSTKVTAIREASNIRGTISDIITAGLNAEPTDNSAPNSTEVKQEQATVP